MSTNGDSEVAASAADVIQSMEASADGVFTKSAFASRVWNARRRLCFGFCELKWLPQCPPLTSETAEESLRK
ncbi:MAG: hypothetical protein ACTS41_01770 [Candidatus Hodgkinia cicadicola]